MAAEEINLRYVILGKRLVGTLSLLAYATKGDYNEVELK